MALGASAAAVVAVTAVLAAGVEACAAEKVDTTRAATRVQTSVTILLGNDRERAAYRVVVARWAGGLGGAGGCVRMGLTRGLAFCRVDACAVPARQSIICR
ncbi:hypothetical protein GCM10027067_28410 [Pseudactinotalea suaedae]